MKQTHIIYRGEFICTGSYAPLDRHGHCFEHHRADFGPQPPPCPRVFDDGETEIHLSLRGTSQDFVAEDAEGYDWTNYLTEEEWRAFSEALYQSYLDERENRAWDDGKAWRRGDL